MRLPGNRVARWFICILKIQIWVYFGGPLNGKCWYILWPSGNFNSYFVYFVIIWYISSRFGKLNQMKNLATLCLQSIGIFSRFILCSLEVPHKLFARKMIEPLTLDIIT
jgi:hypothetical protein